VAGAAGVDIDPEIWIFTDEFSRGSGVIEVDVGEKDGIEIGDSDAAQAELFAQSFRRGFRTRVDERAMIVGLE
jgi:hypothetical protein